jgi:hypothetical protein
MSFTPVDVVLFPIGPLLHLELGQLGGEVHDSNGHKFRLPQQTHSCAETGRRKMGTN